MFWDKHVDDLAAAVGSPPSQIKLISILLISYPLASLFVRLPASKPNLSHAFSVIVSFFYLGPVLGLRSGLAHLVFSALGTHVLVRSLKGPNMPWIVFGFVMAHLLSNHWKNYVYGVSPDVVDVTFSQMVLVQNLSMFAWNVHDGRHKKEDLDATQQATRLVQVPSLLAFFGYCFFFPAMLIGPAMDYSTYEATIRRTIYSRAPPGSGAGQAQAAARRLPHGRRRVAYLQMVIGLCFLGIYATQGTRGSFERMLGDDFGGWSWCWKFAFVQFCGFIARTKYYAVWSLSEGACILTGAGFNGYDPKTGRTLWNRLRNIDIVSIERAESLKVLLDSWNCRTNVWLRECVYKRLVVRGRKPGTKESMATFLTSAAWHGVEPGYYLAFITAGLLSFIAKSFRRYVRPHVLPVSPAPGIAAPTTNPAKRAYDVMGNVMVQVNINYTVAAFLLLKLDKCFRAWSQVWWYGHVLIVVCVGFFQAGGRRWLRKHLPPVVVPAVQPQSPGVVTNGTDSVNREPGISAGSAASSKPSSATPSPSRSRSSSDAVPPDSPADEDDPKDLQWIKYALDSASYGRPRGIEPDGGLVDQLMRGAETPGTETPPTSAWAS